MHNKESFFKKYQKVPVKEYENEVSKKPLVSVCIQTYQHEKYIAECLEGILMQKTNFDFEVLLGEDASLDQTRQICLEYAKRYPKKIRLFLHLRENNIVLNGSPTWHFNSLYNKLNVRGKYIAFCEGDDYWTDPNKLQKQVDFLEKNPDFSACAHLSNVIFENAKAQNEDRFKRQTKKTIFTSNDLLEHTQFHTSSLLYKHRLVDLDRLIRCGVFALNRDHPLMIILASLGPIKRLPEVMSTYRRNDGGISENISSQKTYNANIEMANSLPRYIKGFKLKSLYIKGHWHRYMVKNAKAFSLKIFYHFLYFFFTSFYIFPRNGNRIIKTFKLLRFK